MESQSIYLTILESKSEPILYEERDWFVIFANKPCNEGHLLLIPKLQVADFYNLPSHTLNRGFELATKLSKVLKLIYPETRPALFIKGFTYAIHTHIHVTPAYGSADLDFDPDRPSISSEQMFQLADKFTDHIRVILSE